MNTFRFLPTLVASVSTIVCLLIVLTQLGMADVVRMKNGDRLSGEVLRVEGEKLELKTEYAGKVRIDWSAVDRVEMEEAQRMWVATDEALEVSEISRSDDGRLELAGSGERCELTDEELKVLNPTDVELGKKGEFSGRINVSWKSERGNDVKDDLDMDFKVRYERGVNQLNFTGGIEYDDRNQAATKRDWHLGGEYKRYFSDKLFGAYWYRAKSEKSAQLDLRQVTGPLMGYRFFNGPPVELESQLGLLYVHEEYKQRIARYMGPAWTVSYEQGLLDGALTLYHDHSLLLGLDDKTKALWQSWTGLRYPIAGGVVGSLEYEVDYDSNPAFRAKELDQTWRFKLGYEW